MANIITVNHYSYEKKEVEWLKQLANVITEPKKLLKILEIEDKYITKKSAKLNNIFPLRVPQSFINRMEKNKIKDPLLLQVLIQHQEFLKISGYTKDPLNEQQNKIPCLLHRYRNRIILLLKGGCAIHCRYCFRRYFPYQNNQGNKNNWKKALNYISSNNEINEIIFSGGDPLIAKDHELEWIISQLENISNLKKLRIHSRFPVVIPSRVTNKLCQILKKTRLKIILVTHINHSQEINEELFDAISKLKRIGVTLFNQSVLLKGINDDLESLMKLNNTLFDIGIFPYYLHMLDKVQGTSHFYVTKYKAIKLLKQLSSRVSGYIVPKLIENSQNIKITLNNRN
ncbi:EF-P beta-lysylation protein EpmB [Pantoea sp. SoEX]|uniref:EF-P beta-lysylation protein EpmB n=1 Tax=Pantoea sp. SoEX TaxID=2576763 RepID=UPI00135A31CB|nr:EF-P beta-lysylation protein EpmB [Pantoea sp. SoEX]MXP51077.1 EF-P beta-lysylation protein EpmB [Pantoea sp. SoEX]